MKIISKRKGLFQARLLSLRGKEQGVLCRSPHLPVGTERAPQSWLIGANQKILDWWVKTTFLGEAEIVFTLVLSHNLGIWPKWCHLGPMIFFVTIQMGKYRIQNKFNGRKVKWDANLSTAYLRNLYIIIIVTLVAV